MEIIHDQNGWIVNLSSSFMNDYLTVSINESVVVLDKRSSYMHTEYYDFVIWLLWMKNCNQMTDAHAHLFDDIHLFMMIYYTFGLYRTELYAELRRIFRNRICLIEWAETIEIVLENSDYAWRTSQRKRNINKATIYSKTKTNFLFANANAKKKINK